MNSQRLIDASFPHHTIWLQLHSKLNLPSTHTFQMAFSATGHPIHFT